MFWIAITIVFGLTSFLMAKRYTWASDVTVVPVVGETIYQRAGQASVVGRPSVQYATTEASSFLITTFHSAHNPREVIVVIADLVLSKPCSILGGALLGSPQFLGRANPPSRLGEQHEVAIYRLRILPERSQLVSMTCDVAVAPGADSYATRNLEYTPMPAVGAGVPSGFGALWPQNVSFSAAGTVDLAVTGDIAPGPMAHAYEEREIGPNTFTARARWTSVQAQASRDYGLFIAAVIAGIAATSLVEVLRRIFAHTFAKGDPSQ